MTGGAAALAVRDLRVGYRGVIAVDGLSLDVASGQTVGLIGPNGAGKTTTFNAINGLLRPLAGSIELAGVDVTNRSAAARARRGLGRTFQRMELVNAMSVRTNVGLGAECRLVGSNPVRQVLSSAAQRRALAEASDDALDACAIGAIADRMVGTLSTGQRRLVEFARALAGAYQVLLLDEPSSGLDEEETSAFAATLTGAVRERSLAVLLVEHDMALVMSVCSRIDVLDFGTPIFSGTPAQTRASAIVRRAYLGEEPVEVGQ